MSIKSSNHIVSDIDLAKKSNIKVGDKIIKKAQKVGKVRQKNKKNKKPKSKKPKSKKQQSKKPLFEIKQIGEKRSKEFDKEIIRYFKINQLKPTSIKDKELLRKMLTALVEKTITIDNTKQMVKFKLYHYMQKY
jgi:hypothetical protein